MIVLAFASVCIVALVVVFALDRSRTSQLVKALDDRASDLDTYREHIMELTEAFANQAVILSRRDGSEHARVIEALTSDRNRLVTAALAAGGTNPAAATLLARADQANAQAERAHTVRDLLDQTLVERAGVATEYEDERGHAIVPVGL